MLETVNEKDTNRLSEAVVDKWECPLLMSIGGGMGGAGMFCQSVDAAPWFGSARGAAGSTMARSVGRVLGDAAHAVADFHINGNVGQVLDHVARGLSPEWPSRQDVSLLFHRN